MTDETPGNESVNEAEGIIKAELDRLQSGEECVEGDECPVHHRLDFQEMDDEDEYGRLITYVGEYCVITTDNPDLMSASTLLRLILGLYKKEDVPEKFETCVIYVGDGSVGDVSNMDREGQDKAIRYIHKHSDWEYFRDQHEAVLIGVEQGLIDVSKPVNGKEK